MDSTVKQHNQKGLCCLLLFYLFVKYIHFHSFHGGALCNGERLWPVTCLLHSFVECSGNYVCLLFRGQFDKVYCITGYADGKLGIFLGMFLGI